jgi:L-amino acid N-acyltransferase YncA
MLIEVRKYQDQDLAAMIKIWNEVVADGIAFPQTETLNLDSAGDFFGGQSFTGVAELEGQIAGLYILHPNNIGRCGHIANASYAVNSLYRGKHIGERLVLHSLQQSRDLNFKILQFNAVVETNSGAVHLYEKLGFVRLGTIPGGFLTKNGKYENIILFYYAL